MNQTTSHIDFEKITDFVQGKIGETEQAEVAGHLAACPVCAMQKKRLEQTLETMFSDKTEDVPVYLSERVFDMFDVQLAPEKTPVREKILAALQFDKFVPAFGLRSSERPEIRNIHFVAKNYLIVIQINPTGADEWQINGEIFGDAVGGEVELESEGETRLAEINDFAKFSFDGVKAGKYNLCVKIENCEINFPELFVEY